MKQILNLVYNLFDSSRKDNGLFYKLHSSFFSSKNTVKYFFGSEVYGEFQKVEYTHKYDLTTILLKITLDKFLKKNNKNLEILEVGTGFYALLSIYLKKKYNHQITATDIMPKAIMSSRLNCEKNNVTIDLITSDLFENINNKKFDVIFWNLPYYNDKNLYLKSLLNQAAKYLNENGKIFLGYNSQPLKPDDVINLTKISPDLTYTKTEKFFWNKHNVSVISKKNL